MQFNSFEFIFVFLPLTIFLFYLACKIFGSRSGISLLILSSLFFYGWWEPRYIPLIVGSVIFNYLVGFYLANTKFLSERLKTFVVFFGIFLNLALLGYFKYVNFFVENFSFVSGDKVELSPIVLPIAISFFTFQQIAYLVDCWKKETSEYSFTNYVLFVTFFPQLLAGPIVHHKEMMPQFSNPKTYNLRISNLSIGLAIFGLGLLKKVLVADQIAPVSDSVFNAVNAGVIPSLAEAWAGALAFTFQLYFDFSAYSDMAIGLGRMIGIKLPLNFFSPYKATNIITFWRRWHITLSRFLKDYLYIPMGGNRGGVERQYFNVLITMLIGGLWHGASWTFVCWGGYHGLLIVLNYVWRALLKRFNLRYNERGRIISAISCVLTFGFIVIGWVFFRAESFEDTKVMLTAMMALENHTLSDQSATILVDWKRYLWWFIALFGLVWVAPNTYQIFNRFNPALVPESLKKTIEKNATKPRKRQLLKLIESDERLLLFRGNIKFLRLHAALFSLIVLVILFVMIGALLFNPGQAPNNFIYSVF